MLDALDIIGLCWKQQIFLVMRSTPEAFFNVMFVTFEEKRVNHSYKSSAVVPGRQPRSPSV